MESPNSLYIKSKGVGQRKRILTLTILVLVVCYPVQQALDHDPELLLSTVTLGTVSALSHGLQPFLSRHATPQEPWWVSCWR